MASYLIPTLLSLSICWLDSDEVVGSQHPSAFSSPVFENVCMTTGKSAQTVSLGSDLQVIPYFSSLFPNFGSHECWSLILSFLGGFT